MNKQSVMMQYFEWYLPDTPHLWKIIQQDAMHLSHIGIDALWLPPAFKGIGGVHDVGYGVYDLYDLGEFDQKGTVRTKYGTKDDYLKAIETLHTYHIQVYGDIVLNHKMGADRNQLVKAYEVSQKDKNEKIGEEKLIEVSTLFTFDNRHQKYSDFIWDWTCFKGIDYDVMSKRHATFLFKDKQWDQHVDSEFGNFDYLMGADIDFSQQKVLDELEKWGKWYLDITHIDGMRLDAIKHIDAYFYKDWLLKMRKYKNEDFFVVGEYWHGNVKKLLDYLQKVQFSMSLFDVPLHYHFYEIAYANGQYDLSKIFQGTLVEAMPHCAVTFVDNHDTQPSQGLQSWIPDWFKPLAYALILLRQDGYPCVFYGDYYGIQKKPSAISHQLDILLMLRKKYIFKDQMDYLDDKNVIGWTQKNSFACIMSDLIDGSKKMYIGKEYAGCIMKDILKNCQEDIVIDDEGFGIFLVKGGYVSVYVKKEDMD